MNLKVEIKKAQQPAGKPASLFNVGDVISNHDHFVVLLLPNGEYLKLEDLARGRVSNLNDLYFLVKSAKLEIEV